MMRSKLYWVSPWTVFFFVLFAVTALAASRARASDYCCTCTCQMSGGGERFASTDELLSAEDCDLATCVEVCTAECEDEGATAFEYVPFAYAAGCNYACIPAGACCSTVSGECTEGTEGWCLSQPDRTWMDGVGCDPNPCAPPVGACCDPDTGACTQTEEAACDWPGTWRQGVPCDPNPCQQPVVRVTGVPTLTEWGMIGFALLAGTLAVLTLRRRRRA